MARIDRHPLLPVQPFQKLHHLRLARRVEPRRRFVEDQDGRAHRHDARQRHPLLLAEAQVVDRPAAERQRGDGRQRLRHARLHLLLREIQVPGAEGDILLHGGGEELVGRVLEDESHALVEFLGGEAPDLPPADPDPAGLRLQQADKKADQRRLSRPVRAQNRDELPFRDMEIDSAERLGAVVVSEVGPCNVDRPHPFTPHSRSRAEAMPIRQRVRISLSLRPMAGREPKGIVPR